MENSSLTCAKTGGSLQLPAPLLTVAIPTFNRSHFLKRCLTQLQNQVRGLESTIEIIISDNASKDNTPEVVKWFISSGFILRYIRNATNVGSDANIAQCFNQANGHYVLIFGDDDILVDGALEILLNALRSGEYGVVCMRAFGFDKDFRAEMPFSFGRRKHFADVGHWLVAMGPRVTYISVCVINRSLIEEVRADQFCGSNLVQVHLVMHAALRARENLSIEHYLVAGQRNNSGGYDFAKVFVTNLFDIIESFVPTGISEDTAKRFQNRLLLTYFPQYLLKFRIRSEQDAVLYERFHSRFKRRVLFHILIRPILVLPRPFAIFWGGLCTIVGRVIGGDTVRGLFFLKYFASRLFYPSSRTN